MYLQIRHFLLLAMGFFFHLDTTDNVARGNSNGKIFPIANRFFFAIADFLPYQLLPG